MPNPADEVFRDFVRYTGDGLPNEPLGHPLPIGDPRSGTHKPAKKPIRDLMRGAFDASTDVHSTPSAQPRSPASPEPKGGRGSHASSRLSATTPFERDMPAIVDWFRDNP